MKKSGKSAPKLTRKNHGPVIALVIPARWGSTRFPGKSLHMIAGKPLVQHVWERSLLAKNISRVLIATDDKRIADTSLEFGAEVVMTSATHPSGTDRIAEVATRLRGITHFINVQGDEPMINPLLIGMLAKAMIQDPEIGMITAATPFEDPREVDDPNCVKVIAGKNGNALYFSRGRIPFQRDAHDQESAMTPLLHLGIYGYSRDILKKLVKLPPSPLELCEKLEQLRALEHGIPIRLVRTSHRGVGVDTPADALLVERMILGINDRKKNR